MQRLLAFGHFVFGFTLLSAAVWFGASFFLILPHMSSGTIWTNLLMAIILAVFQAGPLAAVGVWMVILGHWIWARRPNVGTALLITHRVFLVLGGLGIAYGAFALYAAERSAARGGGLLGAFGLIPLAIGVCISILSMWSMAVARVIHSTGNSVGK